MLLDAVFDSCLLLGGSFLLTFLEFCLCFLNGLSGFVSLGGFLGVDFSHSFVGSVDDGSFFGFDRIVDALVDSCLLFNFFLFVGNVSFFLNFSGGGGLVSASDGSHD